MAIGFITLCLSCTVCRQLLLLLFLSSARDSIFHIIVEIYNMAVEDHDKMEGSFSLLQWINHVKEARSQIRDTKTAKINQCVIGLKAMIGHVQTLQRWRATPSD